MRACFQTTIRLLAAIVLAAIILLVIGFLMNGVIIVPV